MKFFIIQSSGTGGDGAVDPGHQRKVKLNQFILHLNKVQIADASGFHHPVIALLCPEVDRKDTCNWQTEKNEEKGKDEKSSRVSLH